MTDWEADRAIDGPNEWTNGWINEWLNLGMVQPNSCIKKMESLVTYKHQDGGVQGNTKVNFLHLSDNVVEATFWYKFCILQYARSTECETSTKMYRPSRLQSVPEELQRAWCSYSLFVRNYPSRLLQWVLRYLIQVIGYTCPDLLIIFEGFGRRI